MYFIIRFNWDVNNFALTNKKTVGYFRTQIDACDAIIRDLPHDAARNSVAIVEIAEGIDIWGKTLYVFEQNNAYEGFVPLTIDDPRYNYPITLTSRN